MPLLDLIAGELTPEERDAAIQYHDASRALRAAQSDENIAADGEWVLAGPRGMHGTPVLWADRVDWQGTEVPLSPKLTAKVGQLKPAIVVHLEDESKGAEPLKYTLELRIENPEFGAGFMEEYMEKDRRDLDRFIQQVNLIKPGGRAAAERRAAEHADANAYRVAAERELWIARRPIDAMGSRKAWAISALMQLPESFVRRQLRPTVDD